MFCMATYAQNCPFKVRFEKTDATCFNNGRVEFILLDDNDNEIEIDLTNRKPVETSINLMNIKYYYRNMGDTTTHYTPSNIISSFEPGQYVVGVQAICATGEQGSAAYRSLDTNTIVTITSSYVTPSISPMANIATDSTMYGNRPTLPCLTTGRIQLNITGGTFPYTIRIENEENHETIRTVVFNGPQYTGTNPRNYNYVNYFSFDSLAKGNYRFYFTDGCGFSYNVAMEVRDLEIPVIEVDKSRIYAGFGGYYSNYNLSPTDSNKVLFRFYFKGESYNYYYKELGNLLQYRFVNNIAGGTTYTSPWYPFPLDKAASDYYYLNSAEIYIIDTVKTVNQYCALYNQDILWEGRNTSCESTTYSKTFRLDRTYTPSYMDYHTKTTHLSEVHYDPCQFTANDLVHIPDYYFQTSWNSNEWSTSSTTTYYWTYPLHYCFIDNDTHDTIKTIDATTDNTVYLYDTDIENKYGSFEVNDRNINLRWTVTDDQGCVLKDAVEVVTFYHDTMDNVYNSNRNGSYGSGNNFYYEGEWYPDYCCQYTRSVGFYEHFTMDRIAIYPEAMRLLRDGCQFKITSSPNDNMYNMTATYNYDQNKWIVQRENLNNTVEVSGNINESELRIDINEYCLPSGEYKYEFITECDTFRNAIHASFPDNHSIRVAQKPKYTFTQTCDDAYMTPVEGQYELVSSNIHAWDDSYNGYHANDPYESTTPGDAYFKVISGPEGGYPTNLFTLNNPIRFSKPGTYTIRMLSADTIFYCEAETFDTTFTYTGGAVEFVSAAAYLCEANSSTGNVMVSARYGSTPYTFKVYSEPDLQGTLLATNNTGKFTEMPIYSGQKISIELTDNCGYSSSINIDVTDMSTSQIAWFDGGLQLKESCEGSTIEVYALMLGEDATYHWTGPNGYDKYTTNSTINLPRGSESGYYHIELSAPGCSATLRDSVYLRVITSPSVTISEGPTVCPGEEVTMTFTPSGTNGTIHYVIGQEENSMITYHEFSGDNGQSESLTFNAFASNTLWVNSVKDDICSFSLREGDKVVTVRDDVVSACNITTSSETICYNTAVDLTASASGLTYPYTIKWYADADKKDLLQTEEIYEGEHSTYHVNALTQDTTFYVTALDANTCETQYGFVNSWMNMEPGTTTLTCGQSKRLFDSGGSGSEYSPNENISHTFTTTSGHITIDFTMFNTLNEDVLKVISGPIASATSDSIIAEMSGNINGATYTSKGNTLSLLFISKRNAAYPGWDAIVSCDAKPAQSTVKVLDPVTVDLTTSPELPLHYNSDVAITATAHGGKEETYQFTWYTSTDDGSSWTQVQQNNATSSDVLNLSSLTTTTLVKVEVADNAATEPCLDIAQEQLTIHIADIALDLTMNCLQEKTCVGNFSVGLTVTNGGTETATNIVCKLNFPSYISYVNSDDDPIDFGYLGANESKTVTVDLYNAGSFNTATTVNIQGQIWSADQGDSRLAVEYGDWDWQRTPLQADEATTSILIPAAARAEDYIITIPEQAVCYGATAEFEATPHMALPATISWYEDKGLSILLHSDVLTNPGDVSTYAMTNVTSYKSYYLTIENENVCPITASVDYSDKLNYYRVTDNVNMQNGTITISNSDHIRFYDSGGPNHPNSANENYTLTFKAIDGSPMALLLDYTNYNGSFSVYNGPDILQSLPITSTETTFGRLYTSATGYITIRYKNNESTSDGWQGHVFTLRNTAYNEAKATVKSPLATGHLTTNSSEVCFGATATLTASADIAYPQYYTWYASDMSRIVKEETISEGSSTLQIENATTAQPYYVTVGNANECPVTMPFFYSTILMNNINNGVTTTLHDKEVVNFFDEGGPNNNYNGSSAKTYTHTFTTGQGQVVMDFEKYLYLCQQWDNDQQKYVKGDTLFLYDGTDDSAPLLDYITGDRYNPSSYTSTNGSITAKFVICGTCGGHSGWKAKVTNSATAPVQSIVLLNSESHNQTSILTPSDSVLFYDEGGSFMNYQTNRDYTHTFTAMQGNVKMSFIDCINFTSEWDSEKQQYRYTDTLFLYDGASTSAPILTKLTTGCNQICTSTGNSLTVRFVSAGTYTGSGWKASVTTTNPQASMAEAHISFKSPLTASDITTSDVEVCYGSEATLTASSSIDFPQYYIWYSSDLSSVLKRDTITSGGSTLKIAAANSAQPYYVSVGNAANCPVITNEYNISTILLNEFANGATTTLHEKDMVNFYDEGGPNNSYHSNGNLIHTFTTDEGQVIIDFNDPNDCINLCSHWDEASQKSLYDSLYFYDGTDDSAPLLAQYGSTCERPVIKSTTNSLTVKLVTPRPDNNSNSGWRAKVYNSATATVPNTVMLSAANSSKTTTITPTDSILFYDEGGEQGSYLPNSDYTHTFTALQGNVKMTFLNCINFSYDWDSEKQQNRYLDTLFLYDGANTSAPVLAKLTEGCEKSYTSTGNSLTVRFISGTYSNNGWKASVTDANPKANMAEAHITFKTPLDASSITTTSEEVCYGSEATLTASSTIGFPQYFTWYSSDLNKILKQDTINSGVSSFKIDSAISAQPYYVTVGNETECPVMILNSSLPTTENILLNANNNNGTTTLTAEDIVGVYDDGGLSNKYSNNINSTHTFEIAEGTLTAVINSFRSEECCDNLSIYDGTSLVRELKGDEVCPITINSSSNSLRFYWHTDGSSTYDGFEAFVFSSENNLDLAIPSASSTTVLLNAAANGNTTYITPSDNVMFYDEGGSKNNYQYQAGSDYSHTFTAFQGNVQINFRNCINLSQIWDNDKNEYLYDSLYFYDGASTDAPLLAKIASTCNNPSIVSSGASLTVRLKCITNYSNSGWEAQVTTTNADKSMAEARVTFRSPIDPSGTTTTNDEICYGQDATLTAQNTHIAYPQYFTWYDKDGSTELKRDTITSEGVTTLQLTNQISNTNYYVAVSNDTACAYVAPSSQKFASTILLNATTDGQTSYLSPADLVQLFDDGGSDKNYSTPQDRTYTLTATQGNITATVNRFDLREDDTLYFYNGTSADNAHLITTLTDYQYGVRISSDEASMTIRFVAKSEYTRDGFDISFSSGSSPQSGKATATVSIKAPEVDNGLTTTTSTEVCYGDDATLSATSTLATPQYYTWYDETFTTVVGRDTVTTDGAAGEWVLTNQTEDGTYYVTVENATSCPMANYTDQGSVINFNMDASKDGQTTYLKEGDVIYFYDAGGPDGDYLPNLDVTHTLTAPEGSTFTLTFTNDLISLTEGSSFICLFPGTEAVNTTDDDFCLSGDLDPVAEHMAGFSLTPEMMGTTTSNSFTIRFISGEEVSSGFFFIFKVAPDPTTSVSLSAATNGQTTIVSPNDIVAVYDEGGATGSYKTKGEFIHTFTATQGTLAGDFIKDGENRVDIDSEDTIYIYDGAAVDAAHLIATIDRYGESGPTEFESTGKSLTFRFKVNDGQRSGFEAHIHNVFSLEDVPSSKVTVKALSYGVGELTICDNDLPYTLGDTTFKVGTVSGTYQVTFPEASANGCDSIATIDLTVNEGYTLMEEDTIYAYQLPYTWKDTTFLPGTVSGTYTLTRKCVNGCDSTLTLDLTVIQCVDTVEKVTLQVNYTELPYTWRDTIFGTNSVNGTFIFHRKTFDGCDSTVNLTLIIIDNQAPVATPASITATTVVCCADTTAAVTTLEALNTLGFTFTDNDSEVFFKGIKSSTYTGTTCQGTRTTIYEVEDDSHNVTEVTYIQKVNDSIAPALTGTWPANITGINSQLVDSLVNKLYTNNQVKDLYNDCHEITVTSTDATVGSDCGWTITRTYTIEDACGNTAETKSMRVSGFDMSALPQAKKGVSRTGQIGTAADELNFVTEKGRIVTLPRVTRTGRLIKATVPTVSTAAVSDTTTTTALCGGEIVSDGGADLMARGVCWSTQPNPTLTDNAGFTVDGYCTGAFSSELTGLSSGTTYYVRAYATNGMGTSYGEVISFTTK